MRSYGKVPAAAILLTVLVTALQAQSPTAATTYEGFLTRETALRRELETARGVSADLLRRLRGMVDNYEAMAQKYPTSGYSDNALWQGAMLAADTFRKFGNRTDRDTARRLWEALRARFPSSSLVRQVPAQLARLEQGSSPVRAAAAPARAPAPGAAPAAVPAVRSAAISTLTGITRDILPDALRITLTLEHETPYVSQELENPPRLSIDLEHTRVLYALKEAELSFADDAVRQIRVGSHDGERTRVVLDLDNPRRFSIYPMYNPYRLVVDFERAGAPDVRGTVLVAATNAPAPRGTSAAGPAAAARTGGAIAPDPDLAIAPVTPSTNGRGGFSLSRQLGLGAARIVIDPGHGGHDPGARAMGLSEADLVLDVALALEKLLRQQPGVEVVLTRRDSTFIPLEERTAIANRVEADLFLSIHANASTNRNARGIETYFLNFAPNPEAEAIAARENAGSSQTMRDLPGIVRAIALNNKIDESRDFAGHVQKALYAGLRKTNKGTRNLGVKQAPFQVLIGATMPSILAEISFITNAEEGKLLKTEKYRTEIAEALLQGVMAYQQSLKRAAEVAKQ